MSHTDLTRLCIISTTLPTALAAQELATKVVECRLAACAQMSGPIQSVYRWQGQIEQSEEWILKCKTPHSLHQALVNHIRSHHPYDLPEISMEDVVVTSEYAAWAHAQCDASFSEQ